MENGACRLAGYASIFDVIDSARDIVRKGAFARSLAARTAIPFLWQHDPAKPIGTIEALAEDDRGLRIIARLSPNSKRAQEAQALVRDGAIDGLSFGYRVRKARTQTGGGRELLDVDLVEISLVTFPMQPRARVDACAVLPNTPQNENGDHDGI